MAKRFFMYVPWTDDRGLINAASNYTDRIEKIKNKYSEACVIGRDELKEVKTHEPLYIAGHGAAGDENIYGTKGQSLSADDLAAQFDGRLNKGHLIIKLWVCFSADGMTYNRGLAYRFWLMMQGRGFKSLSVYGYREAVLDPFERSQLHTYAARPKPGFKNLSETPELLDMLPGTAQYWRTGIDSTGTIIPPKPLPRKALTSDEDIE